jgi:hypothetical protein
LLLSAAALGMTVVPVTAASAQSAAEKPGSA